MLLIQKQPLETQTYLFIMIQFLQKIYEKLDDFDIFYFQFLDGDVPRHASYGVYIYQLIHFARASSYIYDFNIVVTNS